MLHVDPRKEAAKRRKTPTIFLGVDLEQEAWRYCQYFGFKRNVELIIRHSYKQGSHGLQWNMVTKMTIGHGAILADVLGILLHEVCHVTHMDHSEDFISLFVHSARDLWGINIEGWEDVQQGGHACRAYAVDEFLSERLDAHLEAGGYTPVKVT